MRAAGRPLDLARAGIVVFGVVVAALHLLDRRDPRLHLVSEYALERPLVLGAGLTALSVGGGALAVGVWRALPTPAGRAAAIAFGLLTFSAALLAAYPTDHEGTVPATTPGGRIHDLAAGLTLLSLLLGHLLAWSASGPGAARRVIALVALVILAAVVPPLLAPTWIGIHQRALTGTLVAGLLVLATNLRASATQEEAR